jgi:hypothetical protein
MEKSAAMGYLSYPAENEGVGGATWEPPGDSHAPPMVTGLPSPGRRGIGVGLSISGVETSSSSSSHSKKPAPTKRYLFHATWRFSTDISQSREVHVPMSLEARYPSYCSESTVDDMTRQIHNGQCWHKHPRRQVDQSPCRRYPI